jgi:hypothetical protein
MKLSLDEQFFYDEYAKDDPDKATMNDAQKENVINFAKAAAYMEACCRKLGVTFEWSKDTATGQTADGKPYPLWVCHARIAKGRLTGHEYKGIDFGSKNSPRHYSPERRVVEAQIASKVIMEDKE